jgi:hypothetical protein
MIRKSGSWRGQNASYILGPGALWGRSGLSQWIAWPPAIHRDRAVGKGTGERDGSPPRPSQGDFPAQGEANGGTEGDPSALLTQK